ncbi:porin family protein [Winogradskyella vincentii]|uniref:PorT family protein n=1 Tax=Winogradskyella vincentii TaxID=2877122 RepID=A0ABS7Y1T3_9FLAO|nr:porin family protein [Winogradskyella vincentii]MCA0153847.1 PorT family protein [Winogradskyella vincentii]
MKTFSTLFILLFTICFLDAQNEKGDFTLAPQLGVNFATYYAGSSDVTYDSRTSLAVGVVGEYYINDRWSFRSGIQFDPMGVKDGGGNIDKLNYLTIPLNANWHFGSTRKWYLNFGPAVSLLLSAEGDLSDGSTIDLKDAVPGTDFGFIAGIGYKFQISENFQLFIDYQGFGGFTNLDELGNLPFDIRNSRSSFNVGGVFML